MSTKSKRKRSSTRQEKQSQKKKTSKKTKRQKGEGEDSPPRDYFSHLPKVLIELIYYFLRPRDQLRLCELDQHARSCLPRVQKCSWRESILPHGSVRTFRRFTVSDGTLLHIWTHRREMSVMTRQARSLMEAGQRVPHQMITIADISYASLSRLTNSGVREESPFSKCSIVLPPVKCEFQKDHLTLRSAHLVSNSELWCVQSNRSRIIVTVLAWPVGPEKGHVKERFEHVSSISGLQYDTIFFFPFSRQLCLVSRLLGKEEDLVRVECVALGETKTSPTYRRVVDVDGRVSAPEFVSLIPWSSDRFCLTVRYKSDCLYGTDRFILDFRSRSVRPFEVVVPTFHSRCYIRSDVCSEGWVYSVNVLPDAIRVFAYDATGAVVKKWNVSNPVRRGVLARWSNAGRQLFCRVSRKTMFLFGLWDSVVIAFDLNEKEEKNKITPSPLPLF